MNTPKHTPGPWTIGEEGLIRSPFGFVGTVAGMGDDCDDESQANANLLCASVDLLNALRMVTKASTCHRWRTNSDEADVWAVARAAIAKAEGKA